MSKVTTVCLVRSWWLCCVPPSPLLLVVPSPSPSSLLKHRPQSRLLLQLRFCLVFWLSVGLPSGLLRAGCVRGGHGLLPARHRVRCHSRTRRGIVISTVAPPPPPHHHRRRHHHYHHHDHHHDNHPPLPSPPPPRPPPPPARSVLRSEWDILPSMLPDNVRAASFKCVVLVVTVRRLCCGDMLEWSTSRSRRMA